MSKKKRQRHHTPAGNGTEAKGHSLHIRIDDPLHRAIEAARVKTRESTGFMPTTTQLVESRLRRAFDVEDAHGT